MTFEELESGECLAGLDDAEDHSPRGDDANRDVERAIRTGRGSSKRPPVSLARTGNGSPAIRSIPARC